MSLRILIVEDEAPIALDLQCILEEAGHEVVGIASTMAGALRIATESPRLDLAVMDVDLAGAADGVETARRLREEHDVASLFVSARLSDEVRARAAVWRPVGFIGKPYQEAAILGALDTVPPRS